MKLGRDFTNLLTFRYLTEKEKSDFKKGKFSVVDMDAKYQIHFKRDIIYQINISKEMGLQHIELDGGIPNPYLEMNKSEIEKIKDFAIKNSITLSLHFPYTFIAESTAALQEDDRKIACDYLKKYIDFASNIGCNYVVMHPGSVPYYQVDGEYKKIIDRNLKKSLIELGDYAQKKKIFLHLENNVKVDAIHIKPEDTLWLLEEVWKEGVEVKYCFDIAHVFTLFETPDLVPSPPEVIYEKIPEKFFYGIHIGDYYHKEQRFHPPLHYQLGLLKRKNLQNIAKIFSMKNVKFVVIETAVRAQDELSEGYNILKAESKFLLEIFKDYLD